MEIKRIARKSIILNEDISKGTIIKKEMLAIKRPGTGISPKEINNIVGMVAVKDLDAGTVLKWEDLE